MRPLGKYFEEIEPLKYIIMFFLIVILLLSAELLHSHPHVSSLNTATEATLHAFDASKILSEIAAAIIGAMVVIFLLERKSRSELKTVIDLRFKQHTNDLTDILEAHERRIYAESEKFSRIMEAFSDEIDGKILAKKLFGPSVDLNILHATKNRILRSGLIRSRHEITCQIRSITECGKILMFIKYDITTTNSGLSPVPYNFELRIDKGAIVDLRNTIKEFSAWLTYSDKSTKKQSISASDIVVISDKDASDHRFILSDKTEKCYIDPRSIMKVEFSYETQRNMNDHEDFFVLIPCTEFSLKIIHNDIEYNKATYSPVISMTPMNDQSADEFRIRVGSNDSATESRSDLFPFQGASVAWDVKLKDSTQSKVTQAVQIENTPQQ